MKFRRDNSLTHSDFMGYLYKTACILPESSSVINQYTRPSGVHRNPSSNDGSIGAIARKLLIHLYNNPPTVPPLPSQPLVGRERIREFFADNIIFTDRIEFVEIVEIDDGDIVTFDVSSSLSCDTVEQILRAKGLESFKVRTVYNQILL
jgi:hypothetical protein